MWNIRNPGPVFLLLVSAAICAGCAPAEPGKDGATASDYHADLQSCQSRASKELPAGDPTMSNAVSIENEQMMRRRALILACMKANGWR